MSGTTYTLSIIVDGQDHASGPLRGIGNALGRMGEIAGGILAAGAFMQIGQGIMSVGQQAIQSTAQMQAFEMGLQTLVMRELRAADSTLGLESAFARAEPMAANLASSIKDIAIESPYGLGQVQDTFRLAMAFGFASTEATHFTKGILNMAAGVGASNDMMGRMAYNLAQIRLQGKVTGVDIRQLAMAGLDLNAVLKDIGAQFGVTVEDHEDFNKAVADGRIKWEDFALAFEKYADKNFGGAAVRMSRTLQGLQSTFSDFFLLTMPTLLGPAAEVVTDFLNDILDGFIQLSKSGRLEEIGQDLADWTKKVIYNLTYLKGFIADFGISGFLSDATLLPMLKNVFGLDASQVNALRANLTNALGSVFAVGGAGVTGIFGAITAASLAAPIMSAVGGLGTILGAKLALVGSGLGASLFSGILAPLSMLSPAAGGAFFRMFMVGGWLETGIAAVATRFGLLGAKAGGALKFLLPLAPLMGSLLGFFAVATVAVTAFGVAMKLLNGDTKFFAGLAAKVNTGLAMLGQFWAEQGPQIAEIGKQVWGALSEAGAQLAENVLPWMVNQFNKFSAWFVENGPLITAFLQVLATFFTDKLLPAIVGFWEVVEPLLTALLDSFGGIGTAIMQAFTGDWEGAGETLRGVFDTLWLGIQESFMAFLDWVTGWFGTDWATVAAQWESIWNMLPGVVSVVWGEIKKVFDFGILAIIEKMTGVDLKKIGKDMMAGLLDGISKKAAEVLAFINKLARDIKAAFAGAMETHSPSKVFDEFGQNIAQGLAQGIDTGSPMPVQAVTSMANSVIDPMARASTVAPTQNKSITLNITINAAQNMNVDDLAMMVVRRIQEAAI